MKLKIYRHPFYIQIHSNHLSDIWTTISLSKTRAKASALYPFIITTDRITPDTQAIVINHELIHFAQQKETLIVGGWLLLTVETIYLRFIRRLSLAEAYIAKSTEQEAYDNMFNLNYLDNRTHFKHLRTYLKHKPITRANMWQNPSSN